MSDQTPAVPSTDPPAPPAPAAAVPAPVVLPPENIVRGLLLALITLPAGIVAFSVIYSLGFIASIVALGVAAAAFFLYRVGSGGRVSTIGAVIIAAVTVVTLVLAFLVAQYVSIAVALSGVYGVSWFEVLFAREFPGIAADILADPSVSSGVASDAGLTLLFGLLGGGAILFNVFRTARAQKAADLAAATPPVAPPPAA